MPHSSLTSAMSLACVDSSAGILKKLPAVTAYVTETGDPIFSDAPLNMGDTVHEPAGREEHVVRGLASRHQQMSARFPPLRKKKASVADPVSLPVAIGGIVRLVPRPRRHLYSFFRFIRSVLAILSAPVPHWRREVRSVYFW